MCAHMCEDETHDTPVLKTDLECIRTLPKNDDPFISRI